MQYGFLIDHRRCIGCHACTVACKQENDVPLGSFRTWVKYVEKGEFPAVRRHFAVLRCNHCTSAPCVTICPVTALEKRRDGIVDVDRDVCIGCRACMQACPYDAIYLNEDHGCVEKCHYCAHRVELGLEPACVIVCPEQAIVSGDLHDPSSRIARMVAERPTLRRRVEQGTGPNVHYLDVEPLALEPGAIEMPPTFLWSERPPGRSEPWPSTLPLVPDARVTLDVVHKVEWGAAVALYLVTKGVAAGVALLAPFAAALGLSGLAASWPLEATALLFTAATTFLLVEDLKRPRLFLTLLTRPNWRSWLVKGAWLLIAFSASVGLALVAGLCARTSALPPPLDLVAWERLVPPLRWLNAALALGVAGYTAFLFRQCEGRDLWQSRLLLPHLLVQALVLGAATLLPIAAWGRTDGASATAAPIPPEGATSAHASGLVAAPANAATPGAGDAVRGILLLAVALHLMLALVERWRKHGTANARQGAAFLGGVKVGRLPAFSASLLVLGPVFVPLTAAPAAVLPLVPLVACAGLYLHEWALVRAGQLPPLS